MDAASLKVGQRVGVNSLRFGQGSTDFLATQPGDIFVTDVGPGASAGQLEHLGVFGERQDFAVQFSQESAILQGIRPVMVRAGIFTIPGGSSFGPDFLYNVLRLGNPFECRAGRCLVAAGVGTLRRTSVLSRTWRTSSMR